MARSKKSDHSELKDPFETYFRSTNKKRNRISFSTKTEHKSAGNNSYCYVDYLVSNECASQIIELIKEDNIKVPVANWEGVLCSHTDYSDELNHISHLLERQL